MKVDAPFGGSVEINDMAQLEAAIERSAEFTDALRGMRKSAAKLLGKKAEKTEEPANGDGKPAAVS